MSSIPKNTPPEMLELAHAFICMDEKTSHHALRRDYYAGAHPLKFSAKKMQSYFGGTWRHAEFVENWCAVVIDSVLDRMTLERLDVPSDEPASQAVTDIFEKSGASGEMMDAMHDAMVCGEGFLVAWASPNGGPEVFYNPAENCHVTYHADNPRMVAWGAKRWEDDAGHWRVTLYYPERLEYWRSTEPAEKVKMFRAAQWAPFVDEPGAPKGVAENPYGMVPVFRFVVNRDGCSELDRAIPIQDGLNKTIADMMLAADFSAAPMRYAITRADFPGGVLKVAANKFLQFPPADAGEQPTEVGTLPATDPGPYLRMVEQFAQSIAAVTRTPKHFFYGASGDPSGEALIALEAPLVRKCTAYAARMNPTMQQFIRFLMALSNTQPVAQVFPVWGEVATVQPLSRAMVRQANVGAGFPLVSQLREEGYTDEEIQRILADARMGAMAQPVALPAQQSVAQDVAATATAAKAAPDMAAVMQQIADGVRLAIVRDPAALDAAIASRRTAAA